MKNTFIIRFVFLLTLTLMVACSKNDDNHTQSKDAPKRIRQVIPENILENLKKAGVEVQQGDTPPNIEGTFYVNPMVITIDEEPSAIGRVVTPMVLNFSNQNGLDVTMAYHTQETIGKGQGSLITGSDHKFSVISKTEGVRNNIVKYTSVEIVTGEFTPKGIKNLQMAYVITEKENDPYDMFITRVGQIRVLADSDHFSEKMK